MLSSLDESTGSSAGAFNIRQDKILSAASLVEQQSYCSSAEFSTCTSGIKQKDYNQCTVGLSATVSGTISLTFSRTGTCTLLTNGDTVTRVPSYTLTTANGGVYSVGLSSGATGQTLTKSSTSGQFSYNSDGIRRTFVSSSGQTLLDITTSTTTALTVSGSSRSNRTLTAGVLEVVNNLTSETCSMTVSSVAWTSDCKCPTSGSMSGSCTSGDSISIEYGSTCGSATVTKDSETQTVTLDRCQY